jgi:uncharacterized protein
MEKREVLIVGGDDYGYHDFDRIGGIFSSFLHDAGFHVDVTDDCSCFSTDKFKEYDVVICYMNRKELPDEQAQGLLDGILGNPWSQSHTLKGFIGIHTASCSFPGSFAYRTMLGARFLAHPEMGDELTMNVKAPDHPIMKGIGDFTIVDELYLMEHYPPYEVLLTCDYQGFERPIAWVKPYGLGRVFYLSLGHGEEQLCNDAVSGMIINGVSWVIAR